MDNAFYLSIKNPCSADWSTMTEVNAGRHCVSCEKTVIDASKLSKEELMELVLASKKPICVRALNKHLDKPETEAAIPTKNWMNAGLASSLALTMMTSTMALADRSTLAESLEFSPKEQVRYERVQTMPSKGSDSTQRFIRGTVQDSASKQPLDYAVIVVKGTQIGTMADVDGNFVIVIPPEYKETVVVLRFMCIGYDSKELRIQEREFVKPQFVLMNEAVTIIGEVTLDPKQQKRWWQFWK